MTTEPADRKRTGTTTRWKPDREVFTDIAIPEAYFTQVLRRQAVVNAGVTFRFRCSGGTGLRQRIFYTKMALRTMWRSWLARTP